MHDDIISLADVVAVEEYADLTRGRMRIHLLGAGDIAQMLILFPALRAVLRGDELDGQGLVRLAQEAPDAIPYLISCGCGMPGHAGMRAARNLNAADQMRLVRRIIDVSFPGGSSDFFEEVERLIPPVAPTPTPSEENAPELPDEIDSLEDLMRL